jgi:kynurenine formamidase
MTAAGEATPRNWGRWGEADERGAANFASSSAVLRGASLVRRGVTYPLALPIRRNRVPVHPIRIPAMHFMTLDGGDFAAGLRIGDGEYQAADDYIVMGCHSGTHVDALSHVWYDDALYNGFPASTVRSYGATRCGIEKLGVIVTRGVMLDVAAYLGVEHLESGTVITPQMLQECSEAQGVRVEEGDAVLIRTGWLKVFDSDPDLFNSSSPGIGLDSAHWLTDQKIALVGSDNHAVEVATGQERYENNSPAPLSHKHLLRDCGTYILELLDLEHLARDGVQEFLFVLAPLPIVGGVGSPVNPVAVA